jgi:Relaxase/Mobilisation nuclease domain
MTRQILSVPGGRPLLDIASYGRKGPGERIRIPLAERQLIARTVKRVSEVVVIVKGGGRSVKEVIRHFEYIGRRGDVKILRDEGDVLESKEAAAQLIKDWDLDLEVDHQRPRYAEAPNRPPAKLVYHITLSMPAGTDSKAVFAAAQAFAQDEFEFQHRYAMVLHTDKAHPHVHLVVKAMSEQSKRLHVTKATLRHWRAQFAMQLRSHGIEANATERAVRGVTVPHKRNAIYRAASRNESSHVKDRIQTVMRELREGHLNAEPGRQKLLTTRREIENGWRAIAEAFRTEQLPELAEQVHDFLRSIPPPRTEKEWRATQLLDQARRRTAERQRTR